MIVKCKKGLSFRVQGKRITDDKGIPVSITHDVIAKIREGSLIDCSKIKAPVVIPKPAPVEEEKPKSTNKTVNKEK